jgi:autotransporter-associated beta strand protein/T5SS/PEP-CTERM-associated repeat protein
MHRFHCQAAFANRTLFFAGLVRALVAAVLFVPVLVPRVHAQAVLYWTGNTGPWDTTTAQWSTTDDGAAPLQAWSNVAFDRATFGLGAGTVTLGTPISATSLTFTTSGYTLTGGTLTLSAASSIDTGSGTQTISSVLAGAATSFTKSGSGTLILSGANTYIGTTAIGAGTLVVRGSGASIGVASASASTMTVGSTADATLRIENGAVVKNTSATLGSASGTKGTVVVDGAGSLWNITNTTGTPLSIASGGNGALTVSNGGAVTLARPASFSTTAGHTGDLLVDGAGSTLTSTSLNLQGAGTGTLTVSNGGTITSSNASLGNSSGTGGTVTALVTGAGSQWNVNVGSTPSVTMYGGTSLTIADGGTTNIGWSFYLGDTVGSVAKVTVGGNAATLNVLNAAFVVGDFGSGTLEVNAGGNVNAGYNFRIGNDTPAVGIVNQNGGTVTVTRYIEFNKGTAEYHLLGGTLIVGDAFGAGIVTPTATSYLFELGGGKLQVLGDSNSSLTNKANMTLKAGTTSLLDTPAGGYQSMYIQGTISGTGNLKTTGDGIVVLNKAATYTGSTTIAGGTLRYGIANALSTGTNIIFDGGVLEFGVTPIALTAGTGGRQIQWLGDGGFSSYGGNSTISYEGGAALTWGASNFVPDGHTFLLGSSVIPGAGGTTTFANAIDFGGASRTVQVSDGSVAVDAILSGVLSNGGLVKTGDGTLSLTGANTYAGPTEIKAGALRTTATSLSPNTNVVLNGGLLDLAGAATLGAGTGAGQLSWTGSGGFTVSGADRTIDYAAGAGLTWGTANFVPNGGTFILSSTGSANTTTFANAIDFGGAVRTMRVDNGTAATDAVLGGALSNGGLNKTGDGTLSLTGANTYAGGTTVAGGALIFASGGLGSGATTVNGGELRWASGNTEDITAGGRSLTLGANGSTFNIAGSADNITLAGVIDGTGAFAKSGAGTLTLSGTNTYSGATSTLNAGTLALASNSAIPLASTLVLNGGTLTASGAARTVGSAVTLAANSTVGGAQDLSFTGTFTNSGGNRTLTASNTGLTTFGNLYLSESTTARTLTLSTSGNAAITGVIANSASSGASASSLTKSGVGTLTLSGANTFTGTATVSAGTLRATTSAAALGAGTLTVSGTGALELANDTGLAFGRNTTVSANTPFTSDRLTPGAGVTHTLGTLAIGAQTLALSAGANVTSGTSGLSFTGTATLSGAPTFTANAGTLLTFAAVTGTNRNVTFNGAGDIAVAGALTTGTGTLAKSGTGTLTLSGANTYTGTTAINEGTLSANKILVSSGNSSLGNASSVVTLGTASTAGTLSYTGSSSNFTRGFTVGAGGGGFEVTTADQTVTLTTAGVTTGGLFTIGGAGNTTVNTVISSTGSLAKTGAGTLTLAAANTYSGGTTINAGTLLLSGAGTLGASTGAVTLAGGTLDLGGLTRSAGVVAFTGGTFANGTLTGTAYDARSGTQNANAILAGSGIALTKTTAGTLTLAGANTYSGGTALNAGTLSVSANANLGADTGTVAFNGGTLATTADFTAARATTLGAAGGSFDTATGTTLTWNGAITGSGDLTKLGLGTLLLGGTNDYSGTTYVSAGTLRLGAASALSPNTTLSVAAGATFDANGFAQTFANLGGTGTVDTGSSGLAVAPTGTNTFDGTLTGSGGLTMNGPGTLVLNNAGNSFSGPVTISSGTLEVGTAGALPAGLAVSLTNDATLNLANHSATVGTLTGTGAVTLGSATLTLAPTGGSSLFGGAITGTGGVTVNGSGTIVLSGTNAYTGATAIDAGTLVVNGSIAASEVTVNAGGTLGGSGTVGDLTLASGSFLAPGNSPGTLYAGSTLWAGGAGYIWEINAATGTAGTNWDLLSISGTLTINATSGDRFTLSLLSLTSGNLAGEVENFNPAHNYTYALATASGGIFGFDPDAFAFDTAGFANAFDGTWSVALGNSGHDLNLSYSAATAVPEPSTCALFAGAVIFAVAALRRHRRSAPQPAP